MKHRVHGVGKESLIDMEGNGINSVTSEYSVLRNPFFAAWLK
jgi:hypothetical protein